MLTDLPNKGFLQMQKYILARTGDKDLAFEGEQIANQISPAHRRLTDSPKSRTVWFEGWVYLTRGGKFILRLSYRWCGKSTREVSQDYAFVADTEGRVIQLLDEFDPLDCVAGFPEGDHWAKQQALLDQAVKDDFAALQDSLIDELAKRGAPEVVE
jgi:hypothetical protein